MASQLSVVFLWHLHQPWYPDLDGTPARLPWVRLHALKDYGDLAAVFCEEPRVPHAVNMVPALLDQLELLASGGTDELLELAKVPAESWDGAAVDLALVNLFAAHPRRMIDPLPRYAELAARRSVAQRSGAEALRAEFAPQDLRDLVVLFHLAWSGETLHHDPLLAKLRRRGRRFTESEKDALLARQAEFLKGVLPAWRTAFASGVVEAATSPYHHPILPLLVDTSSGREALPRLAMPRRSFRHPEDARAQIELGLATFERHFGFRPKGMWPPEGSLSQAAVHLAGEAGVAWIASDEDVLWGSLPQKGRELGQPERLRAAYRPYRLDGRSSPAIFFRDHALSDRIGFSYASWAAEDAAADLVARLAAVRDAANGDALCVPIILDGENPWEAYAGNGLPFLRALAKKLSAEPDIHVRKPSDVLEQTTPAPLARIVAGSWIGGTLTTWIGDRSKNRAWDLLAEARESLASDIGGAAAVSPLAVLSGNASPQETAKAALLAAEASDWFWWFGEPNNSAHDPVFDALFRGHLAAAYRAVGRNVPASLGLPVEVGKTGGLILSTAPIAPDVSGARPDYFEWLGAGRLSGVSAGAMSRGTSLLKEVYLGLSARGGELFLRADPAVPPAAKTLAGHRLRILFQPLPADQARDGDSGMRPGPVAVELPIEPGVKERAGSKTGVERIVEVAIRNPAIASPLAVRIELLDAEGHPLESIPADGWVRLQTLAGDWSA